MIIIETKAYPLAELSDTAKDKAREDYTKGDYPGYEWWDYIYDDAVRMAKLIGVEIGQRESRTRLGKIHHAPEIHFSGFCSQGDGASFAGNYKFAPGAVAAITQETKDEELIRIATELQTLQVASRLIGLGYFTASITTSGRYSHSGMMNVEISDDGTNEDSEFAYIEDDVTQLMRDFADWMYKRLEEEHDWLHSEEFLDEQLSNDEQLFEEDGTEI